MKIGGDRLRVLIVGKGQVGTALAHDLHEYEVLVWPGLLEDLTANDLEELDPAAVINAAGKTDLAWCEANAREAFRINVEEPVRLYRMILEAEAKIRYLHFGSGCIWDGPFDEGGFPFEPDSPPSPASFYGWTKASCDALLQQFDQDHVAILRPRQVYSSSASPRNTLNKLLGYPKLVDTPNSMSSTEVIAKSVKHCLTSEEWTGVWNVYDKGHTTPFVVGEMLAAAGLRDTPSKIEKSELDGWHRPKRVDTVLHDKRFEKLIHPRPIEETLETAIADLVNGRPIA